MKVSVVVPVYNKAPFLRECLDSVFAQTFQDFEVIAVDDRSTDDGLGILRALSDPRLRVVALDNNLGPSGAVQRGMDLARGDYIVRMDADDIMFPDRIERQVEFMDSHPEIGASGGRVVLFGEETSTMSFPLTNAECKAELIFGVPISQPASIFRTSVLHRSGVRYREEWPRVAEDWLFFIELAAHTDFGNIDAPLIHYRRGPQNIRKGENMDQLRVGILQLALPKLGLEPTPENIVNHCLNIPAFPAKVDRQLVKGYRAWLDHVKELQMRRASFSGSAVSAPLERSWERLFFFLADHGFAPAIEHMRLSGHWNLLQLVYLLKVRVRVLLRFGKSK